MAISAERPYPVESSTPGVFGLSTHEPLLRLYRSPVLRREQVKKEEVEEKEQLLRDLKDERDSLEQRVIYLTSSIRELEEELALHFQRKS
jgi:hypothetical protein